MENYCFDLWDAREKKLYKSLNQHDLALYSGLLSRDDCYLIQHIKCQGYNGRELRHGDVVRELGKKEKFIIAWSRSGYVLRNRDSERAIYMPERLEVLENKIEKG